MIDESDLDILELEEEGRDGDAFSVGRLITVALGGAVVSLGAYYIYQQLSPERKANLKKQASGCSEACVKPFACKQWHASNGMQAMACKSCTLCLIRRNCLTTSA